MQAFLLFRLFYFKKSFILFNNKKCVGVFLFVND